MHIRLSGCSDTLYPSSSPPRPSACNILIGCTVCLCNKNATSRQHTDCVRAQAIKVTTSNINLHILHNLYCCLCVAYCCCRCYRCCCFSVVVVVGGVGRWLVGKFNWLLGINYMHGASFLSSSRSPPETVWECLMRHISISSAPPPP